MINRIINEKASVTTEMAIKLATAFETTPDFWLNAQMTIDIWSLRTQKLKIRPLIRAKNRPKRRAKTIS